MFIIFNIHIYDYFLQENKNEEIFKDSIEKVSSDWDSKLEKLEQHFVDMENQMIERQKQELSNYVDMLEKSLPNNFKQSVTLLNLKQVQQNLVKQKNFVEANETKAQILALEAEEADKWAKKRAEKISVQEAQLIQKHKKEREAHEKRVQSAFNELNIERNKEISRLTQNYQNLKNQMSNAQKIDIVKITKQNKISPILANSTSQQSKVLQLNVAHQEGPPSIPSANEND